MVWFYCFIYLCIPSFHKYSRTFVSRCHGKMYIQCDGVATGSPLGPTFSNFFMTEVENRALRNISTKPSLYCRYIDDIFVICDAELLEKLKIEMALISGLNFTVEYAINNKLPFLNVLVYIDGGNVKTTVYRKPTDAGLCLNAKSECPNQYKLSVIKGFLHRAKNLDLRSRTRR